MIKKHAFLLLSELRRKSFNSQYKQLKRINTEESLLDFQQDSLKKLFLHAYRNVPFYSERLRNPLVNDFAYLDELKRIPLLTKSDIRECREGLTSKDIDSRRWAYNSSGGSTGEPVRFIQDELGFKWCQAVDRYYYEKIVGIDELSVKKILLWGSESDIYKQSLGIKAKVVRWLKNTKFLNSFRMTEDDMRRYVKIINSYKPDFIKAYPSSIYELSKLIERKGLSIHQPKVIISSAEKLRKEIREKIESVFGTKVYNFYGSREVDGVAGECSAGLLHLFTFNNYTEVCNEHNQSVNENEMGNVIVTTVHNYSMPLIRFKIGDTALLGPKRCKCGSLLPTLKEVIGRIFDHFIREDGTLVYGGYFMHLFYRDWVKTFRIVQEDYKKIRILVTLQSDMPSSEKRDIERKIRLLMGRDCNLIWEVVEEIPVTRSGKHIYTQSLLYHI